MARSSLLLEVNEMCKITKSQENYIKIIYELSLSGDGVHIIDIAARFGVAKSSTCVAVKELEKKDLVRRDAGRLVYLTDDGKSLAARISYKFSVILEFLTGTLHVDQQTAYTDACALEHLVSMETLCAICRLINKRTCSDCSFNGKQ